MSKKPLYQEIAASIRQKISNGALQPDAELPTVREMAEAWQCAPGTVLRAYQELAEQGLVVSRPGAGTRISADVSGAHQTPLQRALLLNQVETLLLSLISSGYDTPEIELAFQIALDRYRALSLETSAPAEESLRFAGSHDPVVSLLVSKLTEAFDYHLQVAYSGSLGGLMALAQHEADIAGAHLWDEETGTYNQAFIRRLLPARRVGLLNLANRRIGLIVAPGNPLGITGLEDLLDARFINRQSGAGTRVWLDSQLRQLGIDPAQIEGYATEALTHSELASAIQKERADVGLGIETAALAYGLDFILLATECYDLVIPEEVWDHAVVQAIVQTLRSDAFKTAIDQLGGYDLSNTGNVSWVV